jgi:hypothetical protein
LFIESISEYQDWVAETRHQAVPLKKTALAVYGITELNEAHPSELIRLFQDFVSTRRKAYSENSEEPAPMLKSLRINGDLLSVTNASKAEQHLRTDYVENQLPAMSACTLPRFNVLSFT